jgi:hypothetical protein
MMRLLLKYSPNKYPTYLLQFSKEFCCDIFRLLLPPTQAIQYLDQ